MPQKFAFTTAAMATALEDTSVSYEDLADIEREFDDVETEISKSNFYSMLRRISFGRCRVQVMGAGCDTECLSRNVNCVPATI